MIDHAGYPNVLEMKVAAKLLGPKKLEFTTIGESGEPTKKILSK